MASVIEPALTTRRWRRVEYERLVELGIFSGPPATVTPLTAPRAAIPVADLLP